jgi:hypothetical protein
MTLEWFHFCEYSFSTSTDKPGVIGIHDCMLVDGFPAGIPFGFAFQIRATPHAVVPITMRLRGPDGVELVNFDGNRSANADGAVFVQMSVALTVPRAGKYSFAFSAGGVELPSQSIRILSSPPQETGSTKPH